MQMQIRVDSFQVVYHAKNSTAGRFAVDIVGYVRMPAHDFFYIDIKLAFKRA